MNDNELAERLIKALFNMYTVAGRAKLDFSTNKVNGENIDFDKFHDSYFEARKVLKELGLVKDGD